MNAVIYARFSSSSQREASIDEQVQVCREYSQKHECHIVDVYSDSAISGKTDDRPALRKLLADSTKKKFSIVVVYSIDRFGRDLVQTLLNEKRLNENGVTLLSATENFTNDPSGRFFRNIMMSYAQFYSDELSAKIRRGMDYNAERFMYNGGGIPLGYRINSERHFEIDPDTAPAVQMIFQMYADGSTVSEITDVLNSQGFKTSKGVPFNKNSLHTILSNKRYLGYYYYKGVETREGVPQWISDELFDEVAKKLKINKKAPARAKAKIEYLLTTKLFCGYCKDMLVGYSGTGKQGTVYRYYICKQTLKKPKNCDKKMVGKDYIEDLVISECRRLLSNENISRIAKEVVAVSNAEKDTSNLTRLQKRLSDNERKYENALNAILESDIESVRKALGEKALALENEHKELEKQIAIEEKLLSSLSEDSIRFFLTSLKKGNINDLKYRKMLINIFVNKIYLYDDRVTITYNSGDEPVTIENDLLSELERKTVPCEGLDMTDRAPPATRKFPRALREGISR